MRIGPIITEFSEYRAYVSHTLWNHRVLMALDNPESVKRRLRDASIWPLTHRECGRLTELFGSLFGFVCEPVQERALAPIRELLVLQDQCSIGTIEGDRNAYEGFVTHTLAIRDCLAGITGLLKENRLGFDPEATLAYLNGRGCAKRLEELQDLIDGRLIRIVTALLTGTSTINNYGAFWIATEDVRLQCRTVKVAAATEDAEDQVEDLIQKTNLALQRCERVVSCWSPNIDASERPKYIEQLLRNERIASLDQVPNLLRDVLAHK